LASPERLSPATPGSHLTDSEATSPVGLKCVSGVAGESRSGDANGQWFRVGAGGGPQMIGFGGGLFGTALFPIQGLQPSKPASPPALKEDVPCETQQAPNLDAQTSAPPPKQQTAALRTPQQLARWTQATQKAVDWLRKQVKLEKLPFQVLDRAANATDIANLRNLTQQLKKGTGPAVSQIEAILAGKKGTAGK